MKKIMGIIFPEEWIRTAKKGKKKTENFKWMNRFFAIPKKLRFYNEIILNGVAVDQFWRSYTEIKQLGIGTPSLAWKQAFTKKEITNQRNMIMDMKL